MCMTTGNAYDIMWNYPCPWKSRSIRRRGFTGMDERCVFCPFTVAHYREVLEA